MDIQPFLVESILNLVDTLSDRCIVTIDGKDVEKNIYKTVRNGTTIRKYVYLENEQGLITCAKLVDKTGRALISKELNYKKGVNGFLIAFPIRQEVKAGE